MVNFCSSLFSLLYILDENSVLTKPSSLTLQKPVMEGDFAISTSQIYPASNLSLDFETGLSHPKNKRPPLKLQGMSL